jgi:drug/metabolite transporter (DMT)-like permease
LPETSSVANRRWTVIASGLLVLAIALVVLYAGSTAFHSPLAVVVLAAIGFFAVLLQLRLRPESAVRAPRWLNVAGVLCAVGALFADRFRLSANFSQMIALGAVGCFAISSFIMLDGIRKSRVVPK